MRIQWKFDTDDWGFWGESDAETIEKLFDDIRERCEQMGVNTNDEVERFLGLTLTRGNGHV